MVLQEILEWSRGRPDWQRDALRRLVLNGELSGGDIFALAEICKAEHGLADPQRVIPLAKSHVPTKSGAALPVSLESIFHYRGVNALAEDQTLSFGRKLTVVYGDNAAGKTGYIRILKSACRTRGQEKLLGNVVSGVTPPKPVVAIKYRVGEEQGLREWSGQGEDECVSRVSIFDSQCAAVYLTEKTDVAFRPFGLDLFDGLVRACKAVRERLETERRSLASNALAGVQAQIPQGTAVAQLLATITSLTSPSKVQELSRLSAEEVSRLTLLEESLLDLQANDPNQLIRQLTVRAERVKALAQHFEYVEAALSAETVDAAFDARKHVRRKREEAKRLRDATIQAGMLPGTGSQIWTAFWESARRFSERFAYVRQPFPVVHEGASCVLCQQNLGHAARQRFQQFEDFVASTTEQELREARDRFARLRKIVTEAKVKTKSVNETLQEIRIDHKEISDSTSVALEVVENKGLKNIVVFFPVASFCKPFVFNDFVFPLRAIRAAESVGFQGSTRTFDLAAVARDGAGGLLRVRESWTAAAACGSSGDRRREQGRCRARRSLAAFRNPPAAASAAGCGQVSNSSICAPVGSGAGGSHDLPRQDSVRL